MSWKITIGMMALVLLISTGASAADMDFFDSCTPQMEAEFIAQARSDPHAALNAALCSDSLIRANDGNREILAEKGLYWAQKAVTAMPDSAAAQLVTAILLGYKIKYDSFVKKMLEGLDVVPLIEKYAYEAARLDPSIAKGGPDRVLGELFFKAPDPPESIGNMAIAIEHFQRAVSYGPNFALNRLLLARALIQKGESLKGCEQLQQARDAGPQPIPGVVDNIFALYQKHCLNSESN
ncbi:hypothetical protein [Desulfovibrio inopinatus]|uniref:hypothetical protein n=1 Tax=Desulfovibrio inopinatus TaxID=102109 RepID=UPI00041608FC|nr:hypothetical protein [Desulfovibrio inopinatus]